MKKSREYLKAEYDYICCFGRIGIFDSKKHPEVTAQMLKNCVRKKQTVYDLGYIEGPDPSELKVRSRPE